jgi:hypothetical protein
VFTSLPDVPAGPSQIVIPNVTCPAAAATCVIRVRGADSTDTMFSNFKSASASPWAPYGVSASAGPAPGQVTLQFAGPSESGASDPGSRHYVAFVCTASCGSDASWSDTGLVIPYPPAGDAPFSTPPYDCGENVTCEFRMQYVDGAGGISPLSPSVAFFDDTLPPTITFTPADGASVGQSRYVAECTTEGLCGGASDVSGVATIGPATVRRLSDGFYWNGSAFKAPVANAPLVRSGDSWSIALPFNRLTDGVSYTVTVAAADTVGNSGSASATFTADKTKPFPTSVAATNGDGTIAPGDALAATFSEPIDPASVPATTTLTMTRTGSQKTKYAIAGVTNAALTTNATGYVTAGGGTRSVTYAASVSVSGNVVTVAITGGCTSGCGSVSTTPSAGAFSYKAAPGITDQAGNPTTAAGVSSSPVVMF